MTVAYAWADGAGNAVLAADDLALGGGDKLVEKIDLLGQEYAVAAVGNAITSLAITAAARWFCFSSTRDPFPTADDLQNWIHRRARAYAPHFREVANQQIQATADDNARERAAADLERATASPSETVVLDIRASVVRVACHGQLYRYPPVEAVRYDLAPRMFTAFGPSRRRDALETGSLALACDLVDTQFAEDQQEGVGKNLMKVIVDAGRISCTSCFASLDATLDHELARNGFEPE